MDKAQRKIDPTQSITEQNLPKSAHFDMILIKGGKFLMGGADEEADDDEKTIHLALLSFYLGKFPVTQSVWTAVMENHPSHLKATAAL